MLGKSIVKCLALFSLTINVTFAETFIINETTIERVAVNGGADSPNVGTTCIKLTSAILADCSGYLAIRNNNKELISAALAAKTSNAKVWLSYYDKQPSQHCPDIVNTSCVLSSIAVQ